MLIGVSWYTFWLLKQWYYIQVQKLVLHRYLLHFSLGLCGLILFSDFETEFSSLKNTLKSAMHNFWLLDLSSTFLFQIFRDSLIFTI